MSKPPDKQPHAGGPPTISEYQADCAKYYRALRRIHTAVFTGQQRQSDELTKKRYTDTNHAGIANLNTFIEILHRQLGDGAEICGLDYGCGSHWFVDYARTTFGWSPVGYDPDPVAIDLARQMFAKSANSYVQRDVLRDGLPVSEGSQHFLLCNAVLQHFDDHECQRAVTEMSRVLRPQGYCVLIFKRWLDSLAAGNDPISPSLRILDAAGGKVLFKDPTMKRALDDLSVSDVAHLSVDQREGWRLLHFFTVEQIVEITKRCGLQVDEKAPIAEDEKGGVLTYRSGKGVPTACLVLRNDGNAP